MNYYSVIYIDQNGTEQEAFIRAENEDKAKYNFKMTYGNCTLVAIEFEQED